MDVFLSRKLMDFLWKIALGRENVVPRKEALFQMRLYCPNLNDRTLREIYCQLPICTCEDGLYIPIKPQEVLDFKIYLEKKVGPIIAARRVAIIYAYYPKLRPAVDGQAKLF